MVRCCLCDRFKCAKIRYLFVNGSLDKLVPTEQYLDFSKKLIEILGKERVTVEVLEGAQHGDPAFETSDNLKKVIPFLDKHLK
jgi:dipeptidyl aminopeptidase/acylaminoacyl peptidase